MSETNHFPTAIASTLARHAGKEADSSAVAAATLLTWKQMAGRLSPVIGVRGVDALFRRALHLTAAAFPWLEIDRSFPNSSIFLDSLQARLADQETAVAMEAGQALLTAFAELLISLIGDSLTRSMLDPVWVPLSPPPEQERPS